MERHVLKEQLKESIGDRKVIAAIFYTFNFDPYFFENYVMPLLVPAREFRQDAIYNNILWRRCEREGLIPPITVYCDYYAKNNTTAPTLGYDIRCIRLPSAKHALVNFHPKECWILLDDDSLVMINGSANLTSSGWCDNLECCTIIKINKIKAWPNRSNYNNSQRNLMKISALFAAEMLSDSETSIIDFLRYTHDMEGYFSNLERAFSDKINDLIERHKPHLIEVISPYLFGEDNLIRQLQEKGVRIHCLVPTTQGDEIMLSRETFLSMQQKGIVWCRWASNKVKNESRRLHAKVYRLHNQKSTITITGSVNFTNPAWRRFSNDTKNVANIESGMIHHDKSLSTWLLPDQGLDINTLQFEGNSNPDISEITDKSGREAPLLVFTINWKERKLSYTGKLEATKIVRFKSILLDCELLKNKDTFHLTDSDVLRLSKNALIEVWVDEISNVYSYYPSQLEVSSRPLSFRISPDTILKLWLFDDDVKDEERLSGIAQSLTDESGFINEKRLITESLLNRMAQHFTALVRLENKLFDAKWADCHDQCRTMSYYLLSENIDTIPFYHKGLKQEALELTISKGFYWMVLQVMINRFYSRASTWPHKKVLGANWKKFQNAVLIKKKELIYEASLFQNETEIPGLKAKADWLIEQICRNHG